MLVFALSLAARAQQGGGRATGAVGVTEAAPRPRAHRSRSRHDDAAVHVDAVVAVDEALGATGRGDAGGSDASAHDPSTGDVDGGLGAHERDASASGTATRADEDAPTRTTPRRVYVGIYPFQVPQLDLTTNSYLVDFWLWFRWQGEDIDPSKTFEFMNLYEGWDMLKEPVYTDDAGAARRESLGDGWFYQVFHVQARFGHPFDVHQYPFDTQQIVIAVEDTDATTSDQMYVPDEGTRLRHSTLQLPGWRIARIEADVRETVYPTNFGDTRRPAGADRYSQFRYAIHLERPALGYMATTILPVAIVMMITFVMFAIHSKYFEGRLGLGITSLISAVALQLTAASDLPKTGYLVLLDQVYNLSYLVIFLALLESVVAVRWLDAGREDASRRLDRWATVVLMLLFFGGTVLLIVFR